MDARPVSPSPSGELADLRRRAYGPDADIAADPMAQQRLSELERSLKSEYPADGTAGDTGDDSRLIRERALSSAASDATAERPDPSAAESDAMTSALPADDPSPTADPPAVPRSRWSKREVALVASGAAVVFALGAAAGAWGASEVATSGAQTPDATLAITARPAPWLTGWDQSLDFWGVVPGSLVPHEPLDDVGVWTARAGADARCLILTAPDRILTATCASADLDPIIDLVVEEGLPISVDGPLPKDTVVRFQARRDGVDVWIRRPAGQGVDSAPSSSTVSEPRSA